LVGGKKKQRARKRGRQKKKKGKGVNKSVKSWERGAKESRPSPRGNLNHRKKVVRNQTTVQNEDPHPKKGHHKTARGKITEREGGEPPGAVKRELLS